MSVGFVTVLIGERDFNLLAAGDDVIIGEDVSLLVEDEAGALVLLGDDLEEEVDGLRRRGDVDDRRQRLFVDGDVVHLLGVVLGRGVGFGQCEARSERVAVEHALAQRSEVERGEIPEAADDEENDHDPSKCHSRISVCGMAFARGAARGRRCFQFYRVCG